MVKKLYHSGESEEEVNGLMERFSVDNPNIVMRRIKADTPDLRERLADMYVNTSLRSTEGVVSYKSNRGPFSREKWIVERSLVLEEFRSGRFNEIFYRGPFGGGNTFLHREGDLNRIIDIIDEGFEEKSNGTVTYSLALIN